MHDEMQGRCDNLSWRGIDGSRSGSGGTGGSPVRPRLYGGNGPHLAIATVPDRGFHLTRGSEPDAPAPHEGAGAIWKRLSSTLGTELTVFEFLVVLGAFGTVLLGARAIWTAFVRLVRG
ncbi:hypothetical protein ABZ319_04410 [Nocardia sp. NPDC005978]|uniref:hypothetical protein n=1 Tax=Nocardia sp. NPDC005978 TaxID=3156725 RepID=UPI0033BD4CF9